MDDRDSNKRLKSSSGAPINAGRGAPSSAAANLPAYQPPAAIGARGGAPAGPPSTRPSASVARAANGKTGLRLTVKAPPSKLRQATSGSQINAPTIPPNPYVDNLSESDATPAPATRIARSTRNPRTVVEPESDEEDEEVEREAEVEEQDEDVEGEDVDHELLANEDSEEEDAEGDEDEDMEDVEQDDHPPPLIIKQDHLNSKTMPNVTVTAPPEGTLKSVEAKEMEDEDEEELSELDSNDNENENEEDNDNDDEDDSSSSDIDSSRAATPDLSKLTRRQRGLYDETNTGLMALSNEAQKKKLLTAEEHAMRRAEMARRRKNLSEKRNEEEKMDTINKLLKKPAPRRRTRAEILAAHQADSMGTPGVDGWGEEERPDPLFMRWVQSREGSRLGVPEEWVEGGILGEVFRGEVVDFGGGGGGRMVEEVA